MGSSVGTEMLKLGLWVVGSQTPRASSSPSPRHSGSHALPTPTPKVEAAPAQAAYSLP